MSMKTDNEIYIPMGMTVYVQQTKQFSNYILSIYNWPKSDIDQIWPILIIIYTAE